MASQILHPFDVTGTTRADRTTRAPHARRGQALRAEVRAELPWLLVSVLTAVGAAAATSAWMVESIHLF
jgi:hypothetical protein